MKEFLFVYGTLSPESPDAAILGGWAPEEVRGRLFDLGPYPCLVDLDDPGAGWVAGYVREVEFAILSGPLDEYEGVSEGLFRRQSVTTRSGRRVWVYVYAREFARACRDPIERWTGARIDFADPAQIHRFW